jgi:hypothetical protein
MWIGGGNYGSDFTAFFNFQNDVTRWDLGDYHVGRDAGVTNNRNLITQHEPVAVGEYPGSHTMFRFAAPDVALNTARTSGRLFRYGTGAMVSATSYSNDPAEVSVSDFVNDGSAVALRSLAVIGGDGTSATTRVVVIYEVGARGSRIAVFGQYGNRHGTDIDLPSCGSSGSTSNWELAAIRVGTVGWVVAECRNPVEGQARFHLLKADAGSGATYQRALADLGPGTSPESRYASVAVPVPDDSTRLLFAYVQAAPAECGLQDETRIKAYLIPLGGAPAVDVSPVGGTVHCGYANKAKWRWAARGDTDPFSYLLLAFDAPLAPGDALLLRFSATTLTQPPLDDPLATSALRWPVAVGRRAGMAGVVVCKSESSGPVTRRENISCSTLSEN